MAVMMVVRDARLVRFWCSMAMLSALITPQSGSNKGKPKKKEKKRNTRAKEHRREYHTLMKFWVNEYH